MKTQTKSSKKIPFFFLLSLIAALLLLPSAQTSVFAHKGAHGIVKERMAIMKGMKDHMKIIAQTVKGQIEFDEKSLNGALDYLQKHAGKRLAKLFPKGSAGKKSDADPAIWKDWDKFNKLALSLTHSSDAFRVALEKKPAGKLDKAALLQLENQYDALKQVCKDCHDSFRL
ncbi:MAG: cytochrome c [Hyphomicrobiaceae bacterium]|nr:cytochrome c [Hyphomicrobiaceae bacterium]